MQYCENAWPVKFFSSWKCPATSSQIGAESGGVHRVAVVLGPESQQRLVLGTRVNRGERLYPGEPLVDGDHRHWRGTVLLKLL